MWRNIQFREQKKLQKYILKLHRHKKKLYCIQETRIINYRKETLREQERSEMEKKKA